MPSRTEAGQFLGRAIEGEDALYAKRVELGFDPLMRDRLEEVVAGHDVGATWLRQALAGVVLHFSLEHIPRLVHDIITKGRDSYSAQSWRYVTLGENSGLDQIHPSGSYEKYGVLEEFRELAGISMRNYQELVGMGIPAEDARFCLLWSFDSNMVVTLQGPKLVDFAVDNLYSPYSSVRDIAYEVVSAFGKQFPRTAEQLDEISLKESFSQLELQQLEEIREPLYGTGDGITVNWLTASDPSVMSAVAARACYQELPPSEFADRYSLERQRKFIAETFSFGHTSIAEHPHFIVRFSMSEAGIQQLRRHRIPIQKAKSMWKVSEGAYGIVYPPSIEGNDKARALLEEVWQESVNFRWWGGKKGVSPAELDLGTIVGVRVPAFLVTNATDIVHIGEKRLCERAQWEVRDWAYELAETLINSADPLFQKLGPACFSKGKCPEGKRSCGDPGKYREWRKGLQR